MGSRQENKGGFGVVLTVEVAVYPGDGGSWARMQQICSVGGEGRC